ncbi:hypothetical protein [Roseivirga sp.]|uniref:Cbp1 family collagen-binding glycoprotein adhesin n=1 Tax=Roseivirga sp. TaxID=1964215 RepID=UPI003B518E84
MKKQLLTRIKLPVALMLGATVILSSCNKKDEEKIAAQSQTIQNMENEMARRDSTYNELINMLNNAEEQVAEITRRENLVVSTSNEGNKTEDQLIAELKLIDGLVKESNQSIQNLKAQLKKSNIEMGAFKNRIDKLSTMLDEQRETITTLKAEVDQKNKELEVFAVKYDSVKIQAANQKQLITEKDKEIDILVNNNDNLNKVHYAVGSYKQLKEQGLVDKEGGFLWIGRTIDLKATVEADKFVETDMRDFSELKIEADKFELVTEHPEGSYTIVQDEIEEGVKYLKVTDPKKFWEISNYLVVTTKG